MSVINKIKNVSWAGTFKLALARGLSSGLVISVFGLLLDPNIGPSIPPLLFAWTISSLLVVGFYQLLAKISFPGAGLMSLLISLLIIAGDPIVYIFNRLFPAVLGVADFGILNFHALIIVYHPEKQS